MKYDFESLVNRSDGSSKWNQMYGWNPDVKQGVIPLSVADMELKHPPQLIDGLKKYLDETILGYCAPQKGYFESVKGWMQRRHNWSIESDWIVFTPGVIFAFYEAVKAFTEPGDGVIVMTPVYYPFYAAIERNGRKIVENPLVEKENLHYEIDFADLEAKAKDPKTKMLIFCSPHNPVGRVWTPEEVEKVGRICIDNNVLVLSDEIHFDLIMPGYKHTVFATISKEFEQNCIICTAPSKTFNLAGLQGSNIVVPNEELRKQYKASISKTALGTRLNIMAFKATQIAYDECEDWLDELILLIEKNAKAVIDFCKENLPKVKIGVLEGTYLQWLDFRAYGLSDEELERIMHFEALAFFDEGYVFGPAGSGFERINLAAPTKVILDTMERIKVAMAKYE